MATSGGGGGAGLTGESTATSGGGGAGLTGESTATSGGVADAMSARRCGCVQTFGVQLQTPALHWHCTGWHVACDGLLMSSHSWVSLLEIQSLVFALQRAPAENTEPSSQ
jgi:hypothetical protein